MRVTIGARTSASSLRSHGCSLSGLAALLGFKTERRFLLPSLVILKGSIWCTLDEASFMACLLSCSRDSREDSDPEDLFELDVQNGGFLFAVVFQFPITF